MSNLIASITSRLARGAVVTAGPASSAEAPLWERAATYAYRSAAAFSVAFLLAAASHLVYHPSATEQVVGHFGKADLPTLGTHGHIAVPDSDTLEIDLTLDQILRKRQQLIAQAQRDHLASSHPAIQKWVRRIEAVGHSVVLLEAGSPQLDGPSMIHSFAQVQKTSDAAVVDVVHMHIPQWPTSGPLTVHQQMGMVVLAHEIGHLANFRLPSPFVKQLLADWQAAETLGPVEKAAAHARFRWGNEMMADLSAICFVKALSDEDPRFRMNAAPAALIALRDINSESDPIHSSGVVLAPALELLSSLKPAAAINPDPSGEALLRRYDSYMAQASAELIRAHQLKSFSGKALLATLVRNHEQQILGFPRRTPKDLEVSAPADELEAIQSRALEADLFRAAEAHLTLSAPNHFEQDPAEGDEPTVVSRIKGWIGELSPITPVSAPDPEWDDNSH